MPAMVRGVVRTGEGGRPMAVAVRRDGYNAAMPVSQPRWPHAAGLLLLAFGLELAACEAVASSPAATDAPGRSALASAPASLAAMSVARRSRPRPSRR
jgi:hypothetical protein